MSQEEMIAHWQKGSTDALEAAAILLAAEKYALSLFNCHLAVEKHLKALYISKDDSDPPPTHNLPLLAEAISTTWNEDEMHMLNNLTDYAVAARYDDPEWARLQATKENAKRWLDQVTSFLRRS